MKIPPSAFLFHKMTIENEFSNSAICLQIDELECIQEFGNFIRKFDERKR